ncbi:hypothetical protein [Actinosynnema sp. NPDC023587]|uniref:hypothetical protein n=1 Tax=Actinosynnema sp. NPDC023587 TaxID=3154695 RepID=UPI0033EA0C60
MSTPFDENRRERESGEGQVLDHPHTRSSADFGSPEGYQRVATPAELRAADRYEKSALRNADRDLRSDDWESVGVGETYALSIRITSEKFDVGAFLRAYPDRIENEVRSVLRKFLSSAVEGFLSLHEGSIIVRFLAKAMQTFRVNLSRLKRVLDVTLDTLALRLGQARTIAVVAGGVASDAIFHNFGSTVETFDGVTAILRWFGVENGPDLAKKTLKVAVLLIGIFGGVGFQVL